MESLRDYLESREREVLAPYAMKSGDSRGRRHPEREHRYRTLYQRDRDRIIHCKAFRRLEYKTQVFLNHEGDHYRTRLTHTLEVAQIARTVARALRLNEDLTEAIALAHDLGHTPFGHSGEDALREAMARHGGFEHNRHGLRVVDVLEEEYVDFRGLNLTYEVRESIAKHSSLWDHPEVEGFEPGPPLLEAQVVEVADSIAYDNHDLDDGLSAHIIGEDDLDEIEIWAEAAGEVDRQAPGRRPPRRRKVIIRSLINRFSTDLVESSGRRIREAGVNSPMDVTSSDEKLIDFSPELTRQKAELQDFLFGALYRDYRMVRQMAKAKRFVQALFDSYVEDVRQLPPEYQRWAEEEGVHRAVCDYIAGMTDRYAQDQYLQLFQPYQKL